MSMASGIVHDQAPVLLPHDASCSKDAVIAWFRGEFAAANAIIDALCNHLSELHGGGDVYESTFAAIHQRRLNWIPILQMQKYYPISDVVSEIRSVTEKKGNVVQSCSGGSGGDGDMVVVENGGDHEDQCYSNIGGLPKSQITNGEMAPRIPKGFGSVKAAAKEKGEKDGKEVKDGARPAKKVDPKKVIPPTIPAPKRRDAIDSTDTASKRQRTEDAPSSLAFDNLGPLASAYIKDEEIKEWQAMSLEEATRASVKASAQLLYHSMNSIDKLVEERARLTRLEGENSNLLRKLKENDSKWQRELKAKNADLSVALRDLKEQEEMLSLLNNKFNNQETELVNLKARLEYLENEQKNGWPDEKQRIEDENFEKGFNFYLTGFLANDPEYDFGKFGEESKAEIEQFKIDNAELIRRRRVELGKEEADGAPSDEDFFEKATSPPPTANQEGASPGAHHAPADEANVIPLQAIPPSSPNAS